MSKLYKWYKKDLIRQLFALKREIKEEMFSDEQMLMQEHYIYALEDMIVLNKFEVGLLDKYPYLLLTDKMLKKTIDDVVKNWSTKHQKDVIKTSTNKILQQDDEDFFTLLNPRITIDEQILLIKNEFSKTPELKKAHYKLFNPNNHFLKITKTFGKDAFWLVKNNGYVSNKNNNTIIDFSCLCHEVGHYDELITTNGAIDKKIIMHDKIKLNNYTEVYSIFYELISAFILYDNGYINDYQASLLLSHIKDENTYNIEYFLLAMDYSNHKNTDVNLIRFIPNKLSDLSMYYYSYIIAEKLFKEYLNDKEKAFYHLNYLIKNITPNNEKKVLKYCDIDLYNFDNKTISIKKSNR